MRRLWLTPALAQQIAQHGLEAYPREACGLIGGNGERGLSVMPVANSSPHPEHTFVMDGPGFVHAMRAMSQRGEDMIGIYHTHPHGDPIPSPVDIREAHYPDTIYVVVGLKNRQARLGAWHIRAGQVDLVELIVGDQPPPPPIKPISRTQVVAMVLGMILAFIFVLGLALALLPPAPPIPTR
jgi:proteasome lid subunit RPN8/RPN11